MITELGDIRYTGPGIKLYAIMFTFEAVSRYLCRWNEYGKWITCSSSTMVSQAL